MSERLTGAQISRENVADHMAFVERFAATQKAGNKAAEAIMNAAQAASDGSIEDPPAIAIIKMTKKLEKDDTRSKKTSSKADVKEGDEVEEVSLIGKEEAGDLADLFSHRDENREYHLDTDKLTTLATRALGIQINENSTPQDILLTIREYLRTENQDPDVAVVHKAFNFLVDVTRTKISQAGETEAKDRLLAMLNRIEQAKDVHYEANTVDIQVTDKIIGVVDVVSSGEGLLNVNETLDLFRSRIKNPTTPSELFDYYRSQEGGLKGMEKELRAFKRFMGANFERKNIETPEILQLMDANKTMWALLGLLTEAKDKIKPQIVELVRQRVIE
jgi:hypothetical protein